jgi:biopolymer transport protein ExbB/TolQ
MPPFSFDPFFAASAVQFAFDKATIEGKVTIGLLALLSLFSWTVIITKGRQIWRARRMSRKFLAAYRETREPMDLYRAKMEFDGAPAYEVYITAAAELNYHLDKSPVTNNGRKQISLSAFDFVRGAMERTVSAQGMALEKGMVILSTAVAGGPFIGLLGTVWGVMETFSGVAKANAATLTAMAPGVAGALIATVVGLLVAIPAMFAYNYMVTQVRGITQELDDYAGELATQVEHLLVDRTATGTLSTGPVKLAFDAEEAADLKTSPGTTHMARGALTG